MPDVQSVRCVYRGKLERAAERMSAHVAAVRVHRSPSKIGGVALYRVEVQLVSQALATFIPSLREGHDNNIAKGQMNYDSILILDSYNTWYDPKIRGLRPLLTTKVPKFIPLEMDSPNPPLPGQLQLAFGDESPCRATVFGWFKEFCRGRNSLQDEEHTGGPRRTVLVKAIKLEGQKTVTANWYTTKCLPEIIQEVNVRGLILPHDNASSHTVQFLSKSKLK
ncbi:histone-lysine N-methyltransferase SETMAR [Trichonephila clavipes]|uniref:Histone-lysine N-methyltransferase SETMAR n=1 Tax=Trichonephila clavipes TaxID=2585209 RepID=A0A8X6W9Y4_TRICX|nr:histone-lysine N-methyltransferase SETMAR [Trichonephila clavipes]